MKKIYLTPSTEVIQLVAEPVMGVTSISNDEAKGGVSNFSREGNSWDDED